MSLRKILILLAASATLIATGAARAHTDEYLDTQAAPHGGQMRMAGVYHFELVVAKDSPKAKANPVTVYVTDHAGAKVSTAGASGTVTLLAGKDRATIKLAPAGDNVLKGTGSYASAADLKAVVSVTLAGKPAEQARFMPMMKAGGQDAGKHMGH